MLVEGKREEWKSCRYMPMSEILRKSSHHFFLNFHFTRQYLPQDKVHYEGIHEVDFFKFAQQDTSSSIYKGIYLILVIILSG